MRQYMTPDMDLYMLDSEEIIKTSGLTGTELPPVTGEDSDSAGNMGFN